MATNNGTIIHKCYVKWIPTAELHSIQLYPEINQDIIDYYTGNKYRNYVEEHEIQISKKLC
ncbi:hypothetical protein [Paenibacillus psychroresistens]|uniref:hypothetical protein n=1 Tax=Paenibacillus psychroresistens TaxID=1778678 RepID=UPI001D043302|nr:hypothetical protein [Paenibacillus psychroresistens]